MTETKDRRKTPRKAGTSGKASMPASAAIAGNARPHVSSEETRRQIAEAAYFRAKERGFEPGRELEDWIEAESEVMGRINSEPR